MGHIVCKTSSLGKLRKEQTLLYLFYIRDEKKRGMSNSFTGGKVSLVNKEQEKKCCGELEPKPC